jgi:hypothetical protein
MNAIRTCPECGARWHEEQTCQDLFHQMLFWEWENEYPDYAEVHFLMVLCYHLQHPSLYSPEGLRAATHLLADFVVHGVTPQEVRRQNRARVDSGARPWKITGTPTTHGSYDTPVQWTFTAADVIAGGADNYSGNIRAWARATYEAFKTSGNLASE